MYDGAIKRSCGTRWVRHDESDRRLPLGTCHKAHRLGCYLSVELVCGLLNPSQDVRRARPSAPPTTASDEAFDVQKVDEFVVELYDELRGSVFRYLLCLGISANCADDVIQETFLRLCAHLERGGSMGNLRAWVFRVAHNVGLNGRRNRRHFALAGPSEWESVRETAVDCRQTPEARLLERERTSVFQRAMHTLAPNELRCVHLRMEGLRYREIAEVLGVAVPTVSEHLRRALAKLRRAPNA